jgi:hypothetical protein
VLPRQLPCTHLTGSATRRMNATQTVAFLGSKREISSPGISSKERSREGRGGFARSGNRVSTTEELYRPHPARDGTENVYRSARDKCFRTLGKLWVIVVGLRAAKERFRRHTAHASATFCHPLHTHHSSTMSKCPCTGGEPVHHDRSLISCPRAAAGTHIRGVFRANPRK